MGPCREDEEGGWVGHSRVASWYNIKVGPAVFPGFQELSSCCFQPGPRFPTPAPRENKPSRVRLSRVIMQPETASQHPHSSKPSPTRSLGVSLVLASRVILSHFARAGLSKWPPLFLGQTLFSLGSCFLHSTLVESEKCSCCGQGGNLPICKGKCWVLKPMSIQPPPCLSLTGKPQLQAPGLHVQPAHQQWLMASEHPDEGEFFLFIILLRAEDDSAGHWAAVEGVRGYTLNTDNPLPCTWPQKELELELLIDRPRWSFTRCLQLWTPCQSRMLVKCPPVVGKSGPDTLTHSLIQPQRKPGTLCTPCLPLHQCAPPLVLAQGSSHRRAEEALPINVA